MAIVQDWLPPTRENYETLVFIWQFLYPIVSPPPPLPCPFCQPTSKETSLLTLFSSSQLPQLGSMQWVIKWYGMGKTSVRSPLNIPGRIAWMTMEAPGFTFLHRYRTGSHFLDIKK